VSEEQEPEVYVGGYSTSVKPRDIWAAVEELFFMLPEYNEKYRDGKSPVVGFGADAQGRLGCAPAPKAYVFLRMRDYTCAATLVSMTGLRLQGRSIRTGWPSTGAPPDNGCRALDVSSLRKRGLLPWSFAEGGRMLTRVYVGNLPHNCSPIEIREAVVVALLSSPEVKDRYGGDSDVLDKPVERVSMGPGGRFCFVEVANEVVASTLVAMGQMKLECRGGFTKMVTLGWASGISGMQSKVPPGLVAAWDDKQQEVQGPDADPEDMEGTRTLFLGGTRDVERLLEPTITDFFAQLPAFKEKFPNCVKPVVKMHTGRSPYAFVTLADPILASTLVSVGVLKVGFRTVDISRPDRVGGVGANPKDFPEALDTRPHFAVPTSPFAPQQLRYPTAFFPEVRATAPVCRVEASSMRRVPPPPPPPPQQSFSTSQHSKLADRPWESSIERTWVPLWIGNLPRKGACASLLDSHLNNLAVTVDGIDIEKGPPIAEVRIHRSGRMAFGYVETEEIAEKLVPVLDGSLYCDFHLSVQVSKRWRLARAFERSQLAGDAAMTEASGGCFAGIGSAAASGKEQTETEDAENAAGRVEAERSDFSDSESESLSDWADSSCAGEDEDEDGDDEKDGDGETDRLDNDMAEKSTLTADDGGKSDVTPEELPAAANAEEQALVLTCAAQLGNQKPKAEEDSDKNLQAKDAEAVAADECGDAECAMQLSQLSPKEEAKAKIEEPFDGRLAMPHEVGLFTCAVDSDLSDGEVE